MILCDEQYHYQVSNTAFLTWLPKLSDLCVLQMNRILKQSHFGKVFILLLCFLFVEFLAISNSQKPSDKNTMRKLIPLTIWNVESNFSQN